MHGALLWQLIIILDAIHVTTYGSLTSDDFLRCGAAGVPILRHS